MKGLIVKIDGTDVGLTIDDDFVFEMSAGEAFYLAEALLHAAKTITRAGVTRLGLLGDKGVMPDFNPDEPF